MTDTVDLLREQRVVKAQKLRELGRNPWGNGYRPTHTAAQIHADYDAAGAERLDADRVHVAVAGRIIMARLFGKAGFFKLRDQSGEIQIYCQKQHLSEADFAVFQLADVGDVIYAEGYLFFTKTGELSVHVERFTIATKSLLQLPEKWHGLTDVETRYRQRYVDLIANPEVREAFIKRARICREIRNYFDTQGFLEVETPMMQSIPGGATARPFVTHHNQLDIDLYLRVAPELYLKRLVVGGFERVYEMNRNFRNEGVSTQHNPEFTMIEWYQAWATYEDLMHTIEACVSGVAQRLYGATTVTYQGTAIEFGGPYRRLSLVKALTEIGKVPAHVTQSIEAMKTYAREHQIALTGDLTELGVVQTKLFEATVEHQLISPTFITHFPVEVSPLARRNEQDPTVTDRFELYIYGREIANGFSELNDPIDQANRFKSQAEAKAKGDDEAMYYDADYVRALEHGMPPTAGAGIGIDRLVMLLTDAPSIRDVILFPQLRPEITELP